MKTMFHGTPRRGDLIVAKATAALAAAFLVAASAHATETWVRTADADPGTTRSTRDPAPGTARLSWTAPAGTLSGYRVYWGPASHAYQQSRGSGTYVTGTTYTTPTFPAGTTYYFAVTAIDAAGQESAFSGEASKQFP